MSRTFKPACIVILIAALLAWLSAFQSDVRIVEKSRTQGTAVERRLQSRAAAPSGTPDCTSIPASKPSPASKLYPVLQRPTSRSELLGILSRASHGDAHAALIAFREVAACSRFAPHAEYADLLPPGLPLIGRELCDAIPLALKRFPVAVLEPAVASASEIKLLYAVNATKFSGVAAPDERRAMLDKAQLLAVQASQAGLQSADRFLSAAYDAGLFGEADHSKAYSHALKAYEGSTPSEAAALNYIRTQLPPNEQVRLESEHSGCQQEGSVLANPFSAL